MPKMLVVLPAVNRWHSITCKALILQATWTKVRMHQTHKWLGTQVPMRTIVTCSTMVSKLSNCDLKWTHITCRSCKESTSNQLSKQTTSPLPRMPQLSSRTHPSSKTCLRPKTWVRMSSQDNSSNLQTLTQFNLKTSHIAFRISSRHKPNSTSWTRTSTWKTWWSSNSWVKPCRRKSSRPSTTKVMPSSSSKCVSNCHIWYKILKWPIKWVSLLKHRTTKVKSSLNQLDNSQCRWMTNRLSFSIILRREALMWRRLKLKGWSWTLSNCANSS